MTDLSWPFKNNLNYAKFTSNVYISNPDFIFQILIVLSSEPLKIYYPSLERAKLVTAFIWPLKEFI